jgi:hypothetical protein
MAVIDKINRKGINSKRVVTGPAQLIGPRSGDNKSDFSTLSGIRGTVDKYEINNAGTGTSLGSYTITLSPFSESGFTASHREVGDIAVIKQAGGIATPSAALTCLGRKRPANGRSSVALGPFSLAAGDRLWVVVERLGHSSTKYQLTVDLA